MSLVTPCAASASVAACGSGRSNGSEKWAASSRTTPVTHIASGRFGVIARSKMTSSRPSTPRTSAPSSVPSSRPRMPLWSSPRPSSLAEQSMPSDTTPRILRRSSTKRLPSGPGSVAPEPAYGTTMPATTLGAPHTTRVSPLPVSMATSCSLSASGCFSTPSTRAARTPVISAPGCSTPSTSRPSWLSADTRSGTGASTGVKSRIQERGTSIGGPQPQYCARKRVSPSKKVLISSMS